MYFIKIRPSSSAGINWTIQFDPSGYSDPSKCRYFKYAENKFNHSIDGKTTP